eukprot:gene9525-12464_t
MMMTRVSTPAVSAKRSSVPSKQRGTLSVRAMQEPILKRPELPKQEPVAPRKLFNEEPTASAPSPPPSASTSGVIAIKFQQQCVKEVNKYFKDHHNITIEFQRQRAKEVNKYFKAMTIAQTVEDANTFGWTLKNEIGNGRWVMFGLLVGMLTEYATGVDFIDQMKLMVGYLGLADMD